MIENFYRREDGKRKGTKTRFAIVIETNEQKSVHDVLRIALREGLSPVLVALAAGEAYHAALGLARKLDAPIVMPRSLGDFREVASECAFSICDGINGAILSLLSYTPAYLDASSEGARELIAITNTVACERPIILPFDRRKSEKIKKVGVKRSDFIYAYKGLYDFIEYEFNGSVTPIIYDPQSEAFQSQ